MNTYFQTEQKRIDHLKGVSFKADKNEYFPIPIKETDLNPQLTQNPGTKEGDKYEPYVKQ